MSPINRNRRKASAGTNRTGEARYGYIVAFELPPRPRAAPRDAAWLRARHPANQARNKRWMLHGGFAIEAAHKFRAGLLRNPGRVRFEIRRAVRALLGRQT